MAEPSRALTFCVAGPRAPHPFTSTSGPLRHDLPDGRTALAAAGPAPVAMTDLAGWLVAGCPDPAPVRQGFAAALVDARTGAVTLASGARNEISLWWTTVGGALVVSSHLPSLLAELPAAPDLDPDKLARILQFADDADTSAYRGVRRLPTGHLATWSPATELRARRWFRPQDVEPHDPHRHGDGAVRLRRAVLDAVAHSLPQVGDVSAQLSGGLDSTTVAAAAASLLRPQGRSVHALSHLAAPGDWPDWLPREHDDEPAVRALVDHVAGVDLEVDVNDRGNPLDDLTWFFDRTGYPILNPVNVPWLRRMDERAHERGDRLMLTGAHGSIGYSSTRVGQYRRALVAGDLRTVVRDVRARRSLGDARMYVAHDLVFDVSPRAARAWRRLRHGRDDAAAPDRMPLRTARRLGQEAGPSAVSRSAWEAAVLVDPSASTSMQVPGLNVWHSDPLGDAEVSRVLFSLGPQEWLGDGRNRALARRATLGLLPDEVRLRATRGVQGIDLGRAIDAHQQQYAAALDRVTSSPLARDLLDTAALRRSMAGGVPTQGRAAYEWQLFEGRALGMGLFVAWYEDRAARWPRPAGS